VKIGEENVRVDRRK